MSRRGVTRPMAQVEGDSDLGSSDASRSDETPLERHHRLTVWIPWTIIVIGIWLIQSPFTLGYLDERIWAVPSGGRGVWFSDGTHDLLRARLMTWSDVVSGALLVGFGWAMLRPNRPVTWWAACGVGVWLVFAPVVFWSPSAAAFANDSFIGLGVIALTILVPGMPNMARYMQMGPPRPPGWTYNPSSWDQRWILIALGFVGLLVSRYLAAYQLGYIDTVWDPFFGFGGGTGRVLDSDMSHTWPVSDAGMGAVAYSFEFLMGYMGGPARWRTMPWMVTIFGILVIPLGLAHIALVMSQPVVVHDWCTLCILAAAVMLPMIPLEIDEVVAMGQHVRDSARRGDRNGSVWTIFWLGGSGDDSQPDERTPAVHRFPDEPVAALRAATWGFVATPWLLVSTALGIWLLFAPAVFDVDIRSGAADVAHIGGAAVTVCAVIAMGEAVRAMRWLNVVVGLGVAGFVWPAATDTGYALAVTSTGVAVAVAAVPLGAVRERYAGWQRLIV
ncbi:MAG: vitamin K epoxide reductase family protein [Ilumatobacteraceae bacterium]|nr:vitamin K epoxide reductase family protein [Ilumatobacteraceae bacterium]